MSRRALAVLTALFAASLLAPREASAFCRTWTCNPTKETCPPDPGNPACPGGTPGTHHPLFWPVPCVGFALNQNAIKSLPGTPEQKYAAFEKAANTSFATWQNAKCANGQHPSLAFANMGPAACDRHEFNSDQGNANLIVAHDDVWPFPNGPNLYALTTLTFNVASGEIYDADIEINGTKSFTVGDVGVQVDLVSILTREAGRFLGLNYSTRADATMANAYEEKTTWMRDLTEDDVAGICAIYPSDRVNLPECDPTPRHGFSPECSIVRTDPKGVGGCAVGAGPERHVGTGGLALLAGACALSIARRRRRA